MVDEIIQNFNKTWYVLHNSYFLMYVCADVRLGESNK